MTGSRRERSGCTWLLRLLVLLTFLTVGARAATAADFQPAKNPDWCHERYRCLTIEDYAEMTTIKLELDAKIKKLEFKQKYSIGRFWKTIGVEYELNDHRYHPYATFGVGVGPVDLWGGFTGDSPEIGVGYRF